MKFLGVNSLFIIYFGCVVLKSKRKVREPKEETVTLGPTVREGEHVFGVGHIFASFNDTFIVSIVRHYLFVSITYYPIIYTFDI